MLIELKDLKKGDEVMLAQGANLVFAKLLREPILRFKKDKAGVKYPVLKSYGPNIGIQLYSSMKCAIKTKTMTRVNNMGIVTYSWKEFDNTLEEYNDEKYFDLNFRDIWLIEK
jgi:hypothetical protein